LNGATVQVNAATVLGAANVRGAIVFSCASTANPITTTLNRAVIVKHAEATTLLTIATRLYHIGIVVAVSTVATTINDVVDDWPWFLRIRIGWTRVRIA